MVYEYLGVEHSLISPQQLSDLCGNPSGAIIESSGDYLKFKDTQGDIFLLASCPVKRVITWGSLNDVGCVAGKEISINGIKYLCRLIRGGNGTDTSFTGGGGEWNYMVVDNYSLFPSNNLTGYDTVCLERNSSNGYIPYRGRTNIGDYSYTNSTETKNWRPLLVQLDYPPNISIKDEYLGELMQPINKSYNITSRHGNNFDLIVKLNGEIVKNLRNQTSGTIYDLDLYSNWDKAKFLMNTIEIYSTDTVNNLTSEITTITFNKIKAPITTIPTNSTLTQAVSHMIELNKEIDYQETKLSNNLIAKGVEVLPTDKMSNLIDKVGSIATVIKVVASDNVLFSVTPYSYNSSGTSLGNTSDRTLMRLISLFEGSYKLTFVGGVSSSSTKATFTIVVTRQGVEHHRYEMIVTGSQSLRSIEIGDIEVGDEIVLYGRQSNSSYAYYFGDSYIKGDIL